jgi:hypothetical protein
MPLAARAITRLGNAGTMASELIAFYTAGQPILVIVTNIIFKLARNRSQAGKLP